MRTYHKSWQSDRPMKRDSRKVKWYQGSIGEEISIRLQFEDENSRTNRFYTSIESATIDYESFKAGNLNP